MGGAMSRGVRAKLRYETTGDPSNPAVLFLHGFMGSNCDWHDVIGGLTDDFFCIAVDLPGHGHSVNLQGDEHYTMAGAAGLVAHVLDEIGIGEAHVVGYSMGGRLALYFALHYPERCRDTVIESASPGLRHETDRAARREVDETRARRLETQEYAMFLEEWYRMPMFASLERHEGLLERLITARMRNSPNELARSLRMMGTGSQPSLWAELEDVEVSVLAIAGALDGKYVEIAERMSVLTPRIRTAIISNAGHDVHAERPTIYLDLIREYLTKPSK